MVAASSLTASSELSPPRPLRFKMFWIFRAAEDEDDPEDEEEEDDERRRMPLLLFTIFGKRRLLLVLLEMHCFYDLQGQAAADGRPGHREASQCC